MSSQSSKDSQIRFINRSLLFVEWTIKMMPRWLIFLFVESVFPIAWLYMHELKRICIHNLKFVYGEAQDQKDLEQRSKLYVKSIAYAMMDMIYYVDRPKQLSKITHLEGEENLKKILEQGRGAIAVSAHLGNFPLMFIYLAQKGYKVNVIIRNMRDPVFSKFVFQVCAKWGINMIETSPGKRFLRESLAAIGRNELLFILLDEIVAPENGVKVKFLGRDAIRARGPILFLERTSSPILPMFIAQDEKKQFRIFVEEPFEIAKEGSAQENMIRNITGLSTIVECFVKKYPMQWGGWLNKKWASV